MAADEHTYPQDSGPLSHSRLSERDATRRGDDTERGSEPSQQPSLDDLTPGTSIGRYTILSRLGAGAMGVVFAAYDPELDRRVAVKLLHSRAGTSLDNRARLLREAKALARLSHPNVVAVHDVGTFGERVFLAMEFVAGRTLTVWLKSQPRRWPEIVDVLCRAGEGLAAAHDAGLVHRDFKPDNVLIADDGRVRVLDFGLARSASDGPDATTDPATQAILASASHSRRTPDHELEQALLTRTGALVGTPAYMSPEQHLGSAADPRSDQFSFCITAYQALYGVRPFTASRLSALAFQIIQGKIEAPPSGASVPTWLRKVLLRGLAVDPARRYPTMRALLAAMSPQRTLARRGGLLLAGTSGLALGLGVLLAQGSAAEPPCRGGRAKLAGVWDETRVAAIERAFLATDLPYAQKAWDSTRAAIDAYASAWAEAHNEACAATEIRHEQSDDLLDRRMRCLERRRGVLQALSDALAEPTTSTIEHAPEAISHLGDLAACADTDVLDAIVPPPDDVEKVRAIEAQIASASGRELAGDLLGASELSATAAGSAADINYGPLEAEALLLRARVQQRLSAFEAAATSLAAAVKAAARGRDDRLAAEAWVDLVFHTGAYAPDEGRLDAYRTAAEVALARIGDDTLLRARLDHGTAAGLQRLSHLDQALPPARRAVDVLEHEAERDPTRAHQALNTLALIYQGQGDFAAAKAVFQRALDSTERVSGRTHPSFATILNNLAEVELDQKAIDDAERHATEAAELRRRALPGGHLDHADSSQTLAHIAIVRGDRVAAARHYRDALAIFREHPDVDSMHVATLYNDLALLAAEEENFAEAREHSAEALRLFRARFGEDHPYARTVESNLATFSRWHGEPQAALPIEEKLLAAAEARDPRAPETAEAHSQLGQTLLALGRASEARDHLERALQIFDAPRKGDPVDPVPAAIARTALAQALAALRTDPQRQRALLFLAEPVLADAATSGASEARRALATLKTLRRP